MSRTFKYNINSYINTLQQLNRQKQTITLLNIIGVYKQHTKKHTKRNIQHTSTPTVLLGKVRPIFVGHEIMPIISLAPKLKYKCIRLTFFFKYHFPQKKF